MRERPVERARVLDEGLHRTERHAAGRDAQAAGDRDQYIVDAADEHHRRHDEPRDELGGEAGLEQLLVLRIEAARHLAVTAEDLDGLVPGERLLDLAVELSGPGPLGDEMAP